MSKFKHFNGEKILDLGCGYGFFTDYFITIGANAVGIDDSEKMIEIAKERCPITDVSVMDITKPLDFENGIFDMVFSNQVFMYVENIDYVFSECNRLLKTGGIFILFDSPPCFLRLPLA